MIDWGPRLCLLCDEPVVVGSDQRKWGMGWGNGWVHFDCAEAVGEAAKRMRNAPVMDMTPSTVVGSEASQEGQGGEHATLPPL